MSATRGPGRPSDPPFAQDPERMALAYVRAMAAGRRGNSEAAIGVRSAAEHYAFLKVADLTCDQVREKRKAGTLSFTKQAHAELSAMDESRVSAEIERFRSKLRRIERRASDDDLKHLIALSFAIIAAHGEADFDGAMKAARGWCESVGDSPVWPNLEGFIRARFGREAN